MGLFNWVMTGLGFEGETKPEKKKKDKNKKLATDKYANFNLHERLTNEQPTPIANTNFNFGYQDNNIISLSPKSHKEIQQVVDYLKQGQYVAVNLEGISSNDSERILDFLSGAIYGLNGSITRWSGDSFLLAPEGHKILTKTENK